MSHRNTQRKAGSTGLVLWLFVGILVLAATAVGVTASHQSLAEAWRSATTHQPETYSELYFDNPARLPGYAPARKRQTVTFHIVNHEHTTSTYLYTTTVTINGTTSVHSGSVRLADGEGAAAAVPFTIPYPNETAVITIKLLGTDQQLTFRSKS